MYYSRRQRVHIGYEVKGLWNLADVFDYLLYHGNLDKEATSKLMAIMIKLLREFETSTKEEREDLMDIVKRYN